MSRYLLGLATGTYAIGATVVRVSHCSSSGGVAFVSRTIVVVLTLHGAFVVGVRHTVIIAAEARGITGTRCLVVFVGA